MNENEYDKNVIFLDNCIDKKEQNILENYVSNLKFQWGFCEGIILKKDIQYTNNCVVKEGINPPQFSHIVSIDNNSNIIFLQPIFNFIARYYNTNIHILKCNFNLLTKRENNQHHYPHTDVDIFTEKILSAIYYVNDCDGDTYLFNQFAPKTTNKVTLYKTFAPKKGSILLFDSRRFHCSSSPTHAEKRIVLNTVFRIPRT